MKRLVAVIVLSFALQLSANACESWMLHRPSIYNSYGPSIFPLSPGRIVRLPQWTSPIPVDFPSPSPRAYKFYQAEMQLSRGAVFCRMENFTQKRLGVMFSVHTGGYKERY